MLWDHETYDIARTWVMAQHRRQPEAGWDVLAEAPEEMDRNSGVLHAICRTLAYCESCPGLDQCKKELHGSKKNRFRTSPCHFVARDAWLSIQLDGTLLVTVAWGKCDLALGAMANKAA